MPELPEVETIVRHLRPELVDRTITELHLGWPRHARNPDECQTLLPGRRISGLTRRGKYIIITLEPADRTLLIHLKMSGRLLLEPVSTPRNPHCHTVLSLDDGRELRFNDTRKFGRLFLPADPRELLGVLGPEPLSDAFDAHWLAGQLAKRKRMIKPLLMDQRFIAGLGNIYTDEALFRAGVHPRQPANSLSPHRIVSLHASIREVLMEAIKHQGTSLDWVYPDGEMQMRLRVYGRGGEPCLACGTAIERITLGQRGTHFCPRCQEIED